MTNDTVDEREHRAAQQLAGSLQWPAAQCAPHLCSSVSLQAVSTKSVAQDLIDINKTLRFAKGCAEVPLRFERLGNVKDLRREDIPMDRLRHGETARPRSVT